jgi:hypothetical protein
VADILLVRNIIRHQIFIVSSVQQRGLLAEKVQEMYEKTVLLY